MAEKFKVPVVTLIDTNGAYPGVGAEEEPVHPRDAHCRQADDEDAVQGELEADHDRHASRQPARRGDVNVRGPEPESEPLLDDQ